MIRNPLPASLYVQWNYGAANLPRGVKRAFMATHDFYLDPKTQELNLSRFADSVGAYIRPHHRGPGGVLALDVEDILHGKHALPIADYARLIAAARRLLPGWTILLYLPFPPESIAPYFRDVYREYWRYLIDVCDGVCMGVHNSTVAEAESYVTYALSYGRPVLASVMTHDDPTAPGLPARELPPAELFSKVERMIALGADVLIFFAPTMATWSESNDHVTQLALQAATGGPFVMVPNADPFPEVTR